MAEVILSPGVFQQETDQSFYNATPQVVGAAIVGPTVKGIPYVPTYVTNYNQFLTLYGDIFQGLSSSYYYEYFTSLAAKDYFANGGQTMLVTRIISGSTNEIASTYASSIISDYNTDPAFELETLAWGDIMNNDDTPDAQGALPRGTNENIRWEVAFSDSNSGVFTLLVRRGSDNAAQKDVLETWSNMSLDPQLPNYISRVIGDLKPTPDMATGVVNYEGNFANKSAFIRVKSVTNVMVDSLDNNGDFKTATFGDLMPAANTSGAFDGGLAATNVTGGFYEAASGSNIQGFAPSDYAAGFKCLTDKDGVQFNLLLAPGISLDTTTSTTANAAITTVENRGDAVVLLDATTFDSSISNAVSNASPFLSNYAATYFPWVQVFSSGLGKAVWCPPTTLMGGVIAYNDTTSAPWFAPAGVNRGVVSAAVEVATTLPQADRDTLYFGRVNPLATFPGVGVAVFGQKTLQKKPSSLDRLNVRRLLIALKGFIGGVARTLVFEQNTTATRNRFLAQVNPYLSSVVQRQGLYAYKVIMDASNNTPDIIDQNKLVGQIYIQPTKAVEFVILNFNILPTGATFPA
jgi:hypothetical protein